MVASPRAIAAAAPAVDVAQLVSPKGDVAKPPAAATAAAAPAADATPAHTAAEATPVPASVAAPSDILGASGTRCIYEKVKLLGHGSYGEAWLARRRSDGELLVVKALDTERMSRRDHRYVRTEIDCLAMCDHFAVTRYEQHYELGPHVLIAMEFADAGDLNAQIKSRGKERRYFDESEIAYTLLQLTMALDHVHHNQMLHRDVKGANVMLLSNGLVKLGDFGFSQHYEESVSGDVAVTFCGTPYYLAPELWKRQKYSKKADIWALGILLYEMMALSRPFLGKTQKDLMVAVLGGDVQPLPQRYSEELRAVCKALLQRDPAARPTTADVLAMPYMQRVLRHFEKSALDSDRITDVAKDQIRRDIADVRAVQAAQAAQAHHKADASGSQQQQQPIQRRNSGGVVARTGSASSLVRPAAAPRAQPLAIGEVDCTVTFEGPIRKESGGAWKSRYFLLRNGQLTIAVKKGDSNTRSIDVKVLASVTPVPRQVAKQDFVFALNTADSKTMWMQAPSEAECRQWIQNIQRAMGIDC